MRKACTSAICLALLASCDSGGEAATAEPAAEATVAEAADCNVPELTIPHGDPGLPATLMPGGDDVWKLVVAFRQGYEAACRDKTIGADGLKREDGQPVSEITIHNAPNANIVSIYEAGGKMLLEAPLASDPAGPVTVPEAADITEAIYCYAVGATDAEIEETGRCLPD